MSANPEFDRAQARIEAMLAKWHDLMGIGWLTIKYTYNPNFNEEHHRIIATTEADWEYHQARTDFHLPAVCAIDDDTLERVIVHETVHALTAPMEVIIPAKDAKICEFAVESITRVLVAVHRNSNG